MTKMQPEIVNRNPFIPSLSPVRRLPGLVLVFSVALVGLAAASAACFAHL